MNCKMIVCTLPYDGARVLLVKYRDMPDLQKGWFVPHVLLNEGEHPEAAAMRVLSAQLAMNDARVTFSHFESFTGRDGSWHLIFHFKSNVKSTEAAANLLAAAEWFCKEKLPPTNEIAHHGWAADIVAKCLG